MHMLTRLSVFLLWIAHRRMQFITARKRTLWRLCFYTCLSFCPQGGVVSQHALQVVSQHALQHFSGGWYPSMPCRWYPSMPCSRSPGGSPGPHQEGSWGVWPGGGLHTHTRGGLRAHTQGVSSPPVDGYCRGRYASYWNAFLLRIKVTYKQLDAPSIIFSTSVSESSLPLSIVFICCYT